MYRICIASSGYYFVQKNFGLGRYNVWRKVSPFFRTRKGAKFYVTHLRQCECGKPRTQVVEYC